jgi:hypothetical protein
MPYEGDYDKTIAFVEQLSIIDSIIESFADSHVIICGDFNVDFNRDRYHTDLLDDFCERLNMFPTLRHAKCSIDFTYNFDNNRYSILDHFLLSGILYDNALEDCFVDHTGDNLSDHEPIFLELRLELCFLQTVERVCTPQLSWLKASSTDIQNYTASVDTLLQQIEIPVEAISCQNKMCCDDLHVSALNSFTDDIKNALLTAATSTIPSTADRQFANHRMPGWNEHVEPVRKKSILWHNIWAQSGRPRSGCIADIMRRTRAAYHYAVRRVKRNEKDIVRQRFAEAVLTDNTRNFWTETKKLANQRHVGASIIDGCCDSYDIASLFATKYQDLYNSVGYSSLEMEQLQLELSERVRYTVTTDSDSVCANDVALAVSQLKFHKRDGYSGLSTNHFKHANATLHGYTAALLTGMLVHGSVPDDLRHCTTIPITKGGKCNATNSENYRGITLSSVFGRILDQIVLNKYASHMTSDDLQFGFKRNSSTAMCSMVLKEVITTFTNGNSGVFCTFLDASKAFDKVNYCKLFKLLLARNVPPLVTRLLLNSYTGQSVRVQWNEGMSKDFSISNGVKQGGILSPVLFCVYYDELLRRLKQSRMGCVIGHWYIGALAYADDIVLLAPSATAMRRLLTICDQFADDYNLSFNTNKSQCMFFPPVGVQRLSTLPTFRLNGKELTFVDKYMHLGHFITVDATDDADIRQRRNILIGQINKLLCQFGKLDIVTKNRLFTVYCSSHYGAELWDLDCNALAAYGAAWRTGLRRIWRLPRNAHGDLVALVSMTIPMHDIVQQRFLNFVLGCLKSPNKLPEYIIRHSLLDMQMRSYIARNLLLCCERCHCDVVSLLDHRRSARKCLESFSCRIGRNDKQKASAALELIFAREGLFRINHLSYEDIDCFLTFLLCS